MPLALSNKVSFGIPYLWCKSSNDVLNWALSSKARRIFSSRSSSFAALASTHGIVVLWCGDDRSKSRAMEGRESAGLGCARTTSDFRVSDVAVIHPVVCFQSCSFFPSSPFEITRFIACFSIENREPACIVAEFVHLHQTLQPLSVHPCGHRPTFLSKSMRIATPS